MSPAAQSDELQFCVNLPTCSNGLFTLPSVRNLLGAFAQTHIWILKSDRSQHIQGFSFFLFCLLSTKNAFTKQYVSMKNELRVCSCISNDSVGIRLFLLSLSHIRSDFLSMHLN